MPCFRLTFLFLVRNKISGWSKLVYLAENKVFLHKIYN